MTKEKKLIVIHNHDDPYQENESQTVIMDGKQIYSVTNLCEYPEDATISRDLFSGWEFADTVKLGMSLYRIGYTSLSVETVSCKNSEERDEAIEKAIIATKQE